MQDVSYLLKLVTGAVVLDEDTAVRYIGRSVTGVDASYGASELHESISTITTTKPDNDALVRVYVSEPYHHVTFVNGSGLFDEDGLPVETIVINDEDMVVNAASGKPIILSGTFDLFVTADHSDWQSGDLVGVELPYSDGSSKVVTANLESGVLRKGIFVRVDLSTFEVDFSY